MGWRRAMLGMGITAVMVAGLTDAARAHAHPSAHRIEFTVGGEKLVGDLYLADGISADNPGPAVVVTGAWMTVRQQMATRYARELADRGLSALVFDYRGWGESDGARRQFESPASKITDTEAAADYLAGRPEVTRVGAVGICVSSGYVAAAASGSPTIQSVALAAPWLHNAAVLPGAYGGEEAVDTLRERGRTADAEFRRTGRPQFVPMASLTDPTAILVGVPYYTDPARGMIPAWRNEADLGFWADWLAFDGVATAPALHQPLLMVHSEAAAIPHGAKQFYAALTAPKNELWLDGVTQFDFYDQPAPVSAASDAIATHFGRTLG